MNTVPIDMNLVWKFPPSRTFAMRPKVLPHFIFPGAIKSNGDFVPITGNSPFAVRIYASVKIEQG